MKTNIIEVLRMPRAPNVLYHKQCYASQEQHKDDVVLEVLRLINDAKCVKCGVMIVKGAVYDREDVCVEKEIVVQQSLFDLEGVA
jgi:hypothetical protein